MDSFKVQAVNMPQTSSHKKYVFGDISAAGTYTYDWKVPVGTIVEKVNLVIGTAFDNGGTSTIKVGDMGDDDKFLAATSIKSAARTESAVALQMKPVDVYTGGASGDSEYIVRATIVTAGSAATAGSMYVWFDYRFDPNSAYVTKTYGETSVSEA